MNVFFYKKIAKQRLAICAVALLVVLGIPLTVYAAKARGGAEVATSCATKFAGKPGSIDGCINGGCMALYLNDPVKRRACMNNAKQKIKQLNARKR